jgi:ribosomal protein S18 acetylase RimI-like enzyme
LGRTISGEELGQWAVALPTTTAVREDPPVLVRELTERDATWKDEWLGRTWGSSWVGRGGELVNAAALPGLVAVVDDRPVGLLTYSLADAALEIVTVQAEPQGRGTGRALMQAVRDHGRATGVDRIWLVTTNDNIRAIDFYQRWGMDLVGYHRDAVAAARRLKPQIPLVGDNGIAVRHELRFELRLSTATDPADPSAQTLQTAQGSGASGSMP